MIYILFRTTHGDMTRVIPLIGPSTICHTQLWEAAQKMEIPSDKPLELVSTGHIEFEVHNCSGKSTSIENAPPSRGVLDEKTFNLYNYTHGLEECLSYIDFIVNKAEQENVEENEY